MATISTATAPAFNFTASFAKAATEVIAYADMPQVFGTIHDDGKGDHRTIYYVTFLKTGDRTVRNLYLPADKANGIKASDHPIPYFVPQARPNCDCPHFQARCLDAEGNWNGGVCKHIAARLTAILRDWNAVNEPKAPWVNLLKQIYPQVDLAALPDGGRLLQGLIQLFP